MTQQPHEVIWTHQAENGPAEEPDPLVPERCAQPVDIGKQVIEVALRQGAARATATTGVEDDQLQLLPQPCREGPLDDRCTSRAGDEAGEAFPLNGVVKIDPIDAHRGPHSTLRMTDASTHRWPRFQRHR